MKIKKIATCLFLPIILFACNAKDHSDELKRIDSLLAQDSVEAATVSIRTLIPQHYNLTLFISS